MDAAPSCCCGTLADVFALLLLLLTIWLKLLMSGGSNSSALSSSRTDALAAEVAVATAVDADRLPLHLVVTGFDSELGLLPPELSGSGRCLFLFLPLLLVGGRLPLFFSLLPALAPDSSVSVAFAS